VVTKRVTKTAKGPATQVRFMPGVTRRIQEICAEGNPNKKVPVTEFVREAVNEKIAQHGHATGPCLENAEFPALMQSIDSIKNEVSVCIEELKAMRLEGEIERQQFDVLLGLNLLMSRSLASHIPTVIFDEFSKVQQAVQNYRNKAQSH
jgi:hypothetical protein